MTQFFIKGKGGEGRESGLRAISQYLNIPRPLDVLAVVAPVPGTAEPLGPQLALEDPGHLDTIFSLKNTCLNHPATCTCPTLPQTRGCSQR